MTDGALTFDEARRALRAMTQAIRDAEAEYKHATETAADAEAIYRAQLGQAFRAAREAGEPVGAADTIAREQTAPHVRDRDATAGYVKVCHEVLEDRRDDRRSLWRLIEWSARREGRSRENVPGEEWP